MTPPQLRDRLSAADTSWELLPWRRAERLTGCFLYWMPVASFPVPTEQRQWLTVFLDRFGERMEERAGLRTELFLQMKSLGPEELRNTFVKKASDFCPVIGVSMRPGSKLPPMPTMDDIDQYKDGRKFNFGDYVGDYCYWFMDKAAPRQRETFLGFGGLTSLFIKPSAKPNSGPSIPKGFYKHPTAKIFDLDRILKRGQSIQDDFLPKSKALFGVGLEEHPQYRGLLFIIPLLRSTDFFTQPAEENEKWFQLFDVYVNESPEDKGILLASKISLDEHLVDLLAQMKTERLIYREA
jgi:hypothetical protein